MISLREVDRNNWRKTLALSVYPEQQQFVADYVPIAAIALAKAYIRPSGFTWIPYSIYLDEGMIGFIELAYQPESADQYWIYHFFLDTSQQGKGYGKAALRVFMEFVKANFPLCQRIQLTVHPDNKIAQKVYRDAGFRPTGETKDDEPVYSLTIR